MGVENLLAVGSQAYQTFDTSVYPHSWLPFVDKYEFQSVISQFEETEKKEPNLMRS